MANIKLSPGNGIFNQPPPTPATPEERRSWFESTFKNLPNNFRDTIVFDKNDLEQLIAPDQQGQETCSAIVLSKISHEGKNTLALAVVNLVDKLQKEEFLLGNKIKFPDAENDFVFENLKLNKEKIEQINPGITFNFSMQKSESKVFDTVINRLRNIPGELKPNMFLTVKFAKEEIQNLLNIPNCTEVAFVPVSVFCESAQMVSRNFGNVRIEVEEKATSWNETLVAFPINAENKLAGLTQDARYPVSTESWPRPYPPYDPNS